LPHRGRRRTSRQCSTSSSWLSEFVMSPI
jgi:hypothetical protein